ncbi:hypothetical protein ACJIZ3_020364 [Penstemon smallii]|uniref:Uncharacterized protein n=1 Tax=Penstemon smallii TaxID=265156 RepID=A0ABD3SIZ7_9LAMI
MKKKKERPSKMKKKKKSLGLCKLKKRSRPKKNKMEKADSEKSSDSYDSDESVDDVNQTRSYITHASSPEQDSHSQHDNKSPDTQLNNVFVEGYNAEKAMVPLLKDIFSKYGDIVKNSTFSMESRSCLLELVCSIYKRLEASKLVNLTPLELQSMTDQVGDLELVNVEVGWLRTRLDQISMAREIFKGVSTIEDAGAKTALVIDEKKKTADIYEKELENCISSTSIEDLQQRIEQEKNELALVMSLVDQIKPFYENSLVHGLI